MVAKRFGGLEIARLSLMLAALWAANGFADEKQLLAAIEEQSGAVKQVSQKIFEFKELGQQEFKSSQLVIEELRKLGFKGPLGIWADFKTSNWYMESLIGESRITGWVNLVAIGILIILLAGVF